MLPAYLRWFILCVLVPTVVADECLESLQGRESWDHIRIWVDYPDMDEVREEYPEFVQLVTKRVVPALKLFWSEAMKVRRLIEPLKFRRNCNSNIEGDCVRPEATQCSASGGLKIPIPSALIADHVINPKDVFGKRRPTILKGGGGEEADFALLISMKHTKECGATGKTGSTSVIANAFTCRRDACGRPILGVVHLCPQATTVDSHASISALFQTLAHEMTHTFGFSEETFHLMRNSDGTRRIPLAVSNKAVYYTCRISKKSTLPKIEWDVDPLKRVRKGEKMYVHRFLPDVVAPVVTRSGSGSDKYNCHRCPTDPNRTYTSEDMALCLASRRECTFAVVTPTVVAMTRNFFDCDHLDGAELENQKDNNRPISCQLLEPHWKQRVFGDEYMTPAAIGGVQYVSPITFAFLEDTGWYMMDFTFTTTMSAGHFWGYKMGCRFVQKPCMNSRGAAISEIDDKFFCDADSAVTHNNVCSSHAFHKVACATRDERKLPSDLSPLFQYPVNGPLGRWDFCPVFFPVKDSYCNMDPGEAALPGEIYSESSRCLDQVTGPGMCVQITCESSTSYRVKIGSNGKTKSVQMRCSTSGDLIRFPDGTSLVCADPALVCTQFDFPHFGPDFNPVGYPRGSLPMTDSRREAQEIAKAVRAVHAAPLAVPVQTRASTSRYGSIALSITVIALVVFS